MQYPCPLRRMLSFSQMMSSRCLTAAGVQATLHSSVFNKKNPTVWEYAAIFSPVIRYFGYVLFTAEPSWNLSPALMSSHQAH